MTVEVNIMGFANQSGNVSDVSIEVPDYINLGNVTKDNPVSEEVDVYINNTGKLPITVTPQLKDSDELIFSYLYFRTRTSSGNESLNTFYQIGNYSLNLKKPVTDGKTKEYFYMSLDLTNFDGEIKEDLTGYKADIVFLAMPQ